MCLSQWTTTTSTTTGTTKVQIWSPPSGHAGHRLEEPRHHGGHKHSSPLQLRIFSSQSSPWKKSPVLDFPVVKYEDSATPTINLSDINTNYLYPRTVTSDIFDDAGTTSLDQRHSKRLQQLTPHSTSVNEPPPGKSPTRFPSNDQSPSYAQQQAGPAQRDLEVTQSSTANAAEGETNIRAQPSGYDLTPNLEQESQHTE